MEKGDAKVGQSVDNEPTTGEQLGDSEKVRYLKIFSLQKTKYFLSR